MLQELETQEMVRQSYRFNVGEYGCVVLNDGNGYETADMMFCNAPQDLVKDRLEAYGEDPGSILYANSCLVVNTGDHLVLIDTGFGVQDEGPEGTEPKGMVLQNLPGLGFEPQEFDFVMLLHVFHFEFPGLGYVTKQAGALKWKPIDLKG